MTSRTIITRIDDRFLSSHTVTTFPRGITMDYAKLVEMVPNEKWEPLSSKLIGVILSAKKEEKMPNTLANTILLHMKNGTVTNEAGLQALFEAAVLLDAEKTVVALGELQMLNVAEKIVQQMYNRGLKE